METSLANQGPYLNIQMNAALVCKQGNHFVAKQFFVGPKELKTTYRVRWKFIGELIFTITDLRTRHAM